MDFITTKILTKPFLVTIFRYALTAVGAWLFSKYGFSEASWETISGAILVIATTLMGGSESVKDKAVVDGKAVAVDKLPTQVRSDLKEAVDAKKSRSLFDMLLGK